MIGLSRFVERSGAIALGVPFVLLGSAALREPGARATSAAKLGLPKPDLAVRANGAAMMLGGLALTAGRLPRTAAAGLIISLIPTTIAGHPTRNVDPATREANRVQCLKNLGLIGGLLTVCGGRKSNRAPQ